MGLHLPQDNPLKCFNPFFTNLRAQGHFCMGYSYAACEENIVQTVNMFLKLGFVIRPTKSVLVPTQEVGFLEFLLNSVSMKIEQDQATGVLVVSIWQTQPWFRTLLHLIVDYPLRLPKSNQLLMQPHNSALHPLRKQLKLMVCKLFGTSL